MRVLGISTVIFSSISLLVAVAIFANVFFVHQAEYNGIANALDRKLEATARTARYIIGEHFHDFITNESSVSEPDYLNIVDIFNHACEEQDLAYLWSLLVCDDGVIRFTTGTTTDHNVSSGKHAKFYMEHEAPELYLKTFETMELQKRTNVDKWGSIRVILVPYHDCHGRKYLMGASAWTKDSTAELRQAVAPPVMLGVVLLLIGWGVGMFCHLTIVRPLAKLCKTAGRIVSVADHIMEMQEEPPRIISLLSEVDRLQHAFADVTFLLLRNLV